MRVFWRKDSTDATGRTGPGGAQPMVVKITVIAPKVRDAWRHDEFKLSTASEALRKRQNSTAVKIQNNGRGEPYPAG
jgi:hypothetical protein